MSFNELTIEDVVALYFDDSALREPPYTLYRATGGDARWYYRADVDKYYPSVTTVIHATTPTPYGVIEFFKNHPDPDGYRDERAAYGTWMHMQLAKLLIDGVYDFDGLNDSLEVAAADAGLMLSGLGWQQDGAKDILAFAAFLKDHDVKPLAVEVGLSCEKGFAGAVDLVCEMTVSEEGDWGEVYKSGPRKGETKLTKEDVRRIAIVDFKSGKKGFYESHEIQLQMYRMMWEENFPDVQVDYLFNWAPTDWRTSPSYSLKDQTESRHTGKIPHLLNLFSEDNKEGPTPNLVVTGKLTRDNIDSCYKYQDLRDRFKESFSGDGSPSLFQEVAA